MQLPFRDAIHNSYFSLPSIFLVGLLAGVLGVVVGKRYLVDLPSIDWSEPQEDAAIILSDPQLYSREALINDRRQEAEFLHGMLTSSKDARFRPHLQQVIETTQALRARASLPGIIPPSSQDQATARDGRRETGATGDASGTRAAEPPGARSNGSESPNGTSPRPTGDAQQGQGNPLQDDPRERFRDLQSYRADIRAALSAVNLDDRHDYEGQALYRLQFHATVLPGRRPAKFGVAEVRLHPDLEEKDYRRIYMAWLGYATQRLNPQYAALSSQSGGTLQGLSDFPPPDPRYQVLSQGSQVISVFDICLREDNGRAPDPQASQDSCRQRPIFLALHPAGVRAVEEFLKLYSEMEEAIAQAKKTAEQTLEPLPKPEGTPEADGDPCEQAANTESREHPLLKYYLDAKQVYAIMPYIAASLDSLKWIDTTQEQYSIYKNVDKLRSANSMLRDYFSILRRQGPKACDGVMTFVAGAQKRTSVPTEFGEKLEELKKEQRSYAYATTPIELAQRVSNELSAVTTADIALRLANQQGELGWVDEIKRTMEAIERFPLIVGFADRVKDTGRDVARFGWVFGPRLQSNTNTLEHPVASYEVSADVSIPGWWPKISLELRTGWVANWHEVNGLTQVLRDASGRRFIVPMPLMTPPDVESLTEALTRKILGPWGHSPPQVSVYNVFPQSVSACMNNVTFVIEGNNLWRDPEVYWEGIRGEKIRLLPGMRGITADFSIKQLFGTAQGGLQKRLFRPTQLIIAIRNGETTIVPIGVYGHRLGNSEQCEGPAVSAPSNEFAPRIHAVAPNTVYACSSFSRSQRFLIKGANLGY
ncbi:MAG: hypothetical protein M3361_13330, partial [Candidatus Tectomicrobia bacterium]|nr:hypothetical protein [Candidatus Tectomicrobia bacterium]